MVIDPAVAIGRIGKVKDEVLCLFCGLLVPNTA